MAVFRKHNLQCWINVENSSTYWVVTRKTHSGSRSLYPKLRNLPREVTETLCKPVSPCQFGWSVISPHMKERIVGERVQKRRKMKGVRDGTDEECNRQDLTG